MAERAPSDRGEAVPEARPNNRAVALDLGTRRIGVAVSNRGGSVAFPRPMIQRGADPRSDRLAVLALVEEIDAGVVVVGLPLSLNGREGPAARAARSEAALLESALAGSGVRVETFDERLTTVSADAALASAGKDARARRSVVDSAAATVLLQAWLETR